jgi:hypothetical protein
MMNSDLNMLGSFDELCTYFDLGKTRVVNIPYYARLSLNVNKIATLIISSRDAAKPGRSYIRVWNEPTITILRRIIGSKTYMYSNEATAKTWEALFHHLAR